MHSDCLKTPSLSIFFFSADGESTSTGKYDLVLEASCLADLHGFEAVWTPERHFTRFGGLYPNPAVLSAAIAARTVRIGIRAGSVVLPLHDPIRVAEEWSVVDNLSGGRIGLAFASGWRRADFVLNPSAYADRRGCVESGIETLRRLWAGQTVRYSGVEGEAVEILTFPRPVQSSLRIWITAGSPQTWIRAGRMGANVLALLVPSFARMASLIESYRTARGQHGHDPASGQVTLMVHTYVDESEAAARAKVKAPLTEYLREHIEQSELADTTGTREQIARRESEFLELAFRRRFDEYSLIGPQAKCRRLLERLSSIGVNEVACLVDFGLSKDNVIAGIARLAQLCPGHCAA